RIGRPRRPSPMAAIAVSSPGTLRQRDVQLMLIGVALVSASHAMLYAFSAIDWQKRGFTGTEIGILWSAGVFAEVLLFAFAAWLRRRFDLWSIMIFGSVAAVGRWLLFPADMG